MSAWRFNRMYHHTEGATAIEYALISPVLLLVIMGVVEFSLIMYGSAVLEGATSYASRLGKTGYNNTTAVGTCPSPVVNGQVAPQSQAAYLNCIVGTRINGLFDPTQVQVTYNDTGSSSFNAAGNVPTYASSCTNVVAVPQVTPLCSENAQNAGDIVVYTISYPWKIVTPFLNKIIGTSGVFTLRSSAVVKNEPYSSSR